VNDTLGDTLVMTATFRPGTTPYLVVREETDRILHYLCALVSWARTANVRRVILGENSNTQFDFSRVVRHLDAAGKEIEVLVFDGNKEAERLGKGFGEGEVLEYVYDHSRLLRRGDVFYKITGRLFVSNFDCVSDRTASADAFQRKHGKPGKRSKVNTTFFKCSLNLFESRLLNAYKEVDEHNGVYIEHVYFDRLRDLDVGDLGAPPDLVGQQASTGKIYAPYDEDTIRVAQSLADGCIDRQRLA
jgi:hypothetical protein